MVRILNSAKELSLIAIYDGHLYEWQEFHLAYRTLGKIMTSHSIRKLRIFAVPIMWDNYNHGVIHNEVKSKAVV